MEVVVVVAMDCCMMLRMGGLRENLEDHL